MPLGIDVMNLLILFNFFGIVEIKWSNPDVYEWNDSLLKDRKYNNTLIINPAYRI